MVRFLQFSGQVIKGIIGFLFKIIVLGAATIGVLGAWAWYTMFGWPNEDKE